MWARRASRVAAVSMAARKEPWSRCAMSMPRTRDDDSAAVCGPKSQSCTMTTRPSARTRETRQSRTCSDYLLLRACSRTADAEHRECSCIRVLFARNIGEHPRCAPAACIRRAIFGEAALSSHLSSAGRSQAGSGSFVIVVCNHEKSVCRAPCNLRRTLPRMACGKSCTPSVSAECWDGQGRDGLDTEGTDVCSDAWLVHRRKSCALGPGASQITKRER